MTKEPKPVDKLTKPELLALVKRLHKRITRLEGQIAASIAQPATYEPGPHAEDWQGAPEYTDDATDTVPRDLFPWEKD